MDKKVIAAMCEEIIPKMKEIFGENHVENCWTAASISIQKNDNKHKKKMAQVDASLMPDSLHPNVGGYKPLMQQCIILAYV